MNNRLITSGGVVIQNHQILFIYKNERWDLPKGHIENGSSSKETAIIEISEETGLPKKNLVILKKLIPTHYHKKAQGKVIVKKTLWYLVEFNGKKETPLIPDENEGITKCKWFSLNELVLVLEESHERIRYLMEFCLNMPFFKQYINKTSLF
jgi:8-oxo-dGTP pyrophosphatase MutT (NUDIX family)